MLVQYIRLENLPQHIKCDFKDNLFDESKSNKYYASLKRNTKYFACYDWCTDTIYRFNTYCVPLSIDNELFGKTKESVINELFGR